MANKVVSVVGVMRSGAISYVCQLHDLGKERHLKKDFKVQCLLCMNDKEHASFFWTSFVNKVAH